MRHHLVMPHTRAISDLEADIVALRAAAERAGTALACLFSSSDEFEAAVVRVRREQGAYRGQVCGSHTIRTAALLALMTLIFVLI
jgi:hypothetical protein